MTSVPGHTVPQMATRRLPKRRCAGTTQAGKPCRAEPRKGRETCLAHASQEERQSAGFGGPQPGAGRPPRPRVIDLYRERVAAEADEWWQVLTDAREAQRAVVVGDGEHARLEFYDDHPTRLKAFRESHDRVFGKPMQFVDATVRADESEVDREIQELLAEMDARDPAGKDVDKANRNGHHNGKAGA